MKKYKIPNYPNYYITKNGNNVFHYCNNTFNVVKIRLTPNGYPSVEMINCFSDKDWVMIHRIIGIMFIPCEHLKHVGYEYLEINHIDGIKTNNNHDNLEWCDRFHNQNHAYTLASNKNKKIIISTDLCTGEVKEFYSLRECARKFNVSPMTLHERLNKYSGKMWRGYLIKYKS